MRGIRKLYYWSSKLHIEDLSRYPYLTLNTENIPVTSETTYYIRLTFTLFDQEICAVEFDIEQNKQRQRATSDMTLTITELLHVGLDC